MIVAQVIRTFGGGGAQRAAVNLARGLAEAGCSSRLVAVGELGRFAAGVSELLPSDALGVKGSVGVVRGAVELRRLVAHHGIEVLHVHGSGVLPFVIGAISQMRTKPRVHFTWHDSSSVLEGSRLRRAAVRWSMSRCTSVSASSQGVADRLRAAWGNRVVRVLRNGVADAGPLGDAGSCSPRVVWAARVVPEKRPEWFVRAAAEAKRRGLSASFVLAGAPLPGNRAYFESVRALAADLGAPVAFPGWIEDATDLVRGASIGVQTSETEGLSLSLLEQMMAGLAVVATDVGDTRSALASGACGVLAAPNDEGAFVESLLALIADGARRGALAGAARARAQREYSCRSMAEQMLPAYRGESE